MTNAEKLHAFFEARKHKTHLKNFIEHHDIIDYMFASDNSMLTCHHRDGRITDFQIGRKHRHNSHEELLNDGSIILDGYQDSNWIYLWGNLDTGKGIIL